MSTSLIFSKSLSAVISGRLKLFAVAAIMASGVLIEYFCFRDMAMSFMVLFISTISQSSNKLRIILASCGEIFFFPNSSISVIAETPYKKEYCNKSDTIGFPVKVYIRMLVSTKKSIPLTANSFLIFHPVNIPFQFAEMFGKRFTSRVFLFPKFFKYGEKVIPRDFVFF